MTTEQSASMDAALDDVFSSGRDRGSKSAPPEAESQPSAPPTPEPKVEAAPQQATPQADPDEDGTDPQSGTVPRGVLTSERKKYKALAEEADQRAKTFEAELKAMREHNQQLIQTFTRTPQPQAAPQHQQPQRSQLPDPNEDPFGYLLGMQRMQAEEINSSRINDKLNMSEVMARSTYGDALVDAATQAAQQLSPADRDQLRRAPHPYDMLVKWHKSQETLKVVGSDPEAYRKKIFEEAQAKILEDLKAGRLSATGAVQQPTPQPQQAPQQFPGTLAAATQQGPAGVITKSLEAATGDVFSPERKNRGMRR